MTLTVTKIYDYGCTICEFMGTFDGKVIFDLEPKTDIKAVALGVILDPNNENPFECLIAQYAERYACNADYTIDLPVYILTQGKKYIGHISGEHTQVELRTKLQELVTNATNSEGERRAT
jgi:hypothetical protein